MTSKPIGAIWGTETSLRSECKRMKVDVLKAFLLLAETGNYSEAARRLGISQPAVAARIRTLEQQMGAKLLVTHGHQTVLSESGMVLLPYVHHLVSISDKAQRAVAALQELSQGELVIGAGSTTGTYILPHVVSLFRNQHPGLKIRIDIGASQGVVDRIIMNLCDVGVVSLLPSHHEIMSEPFGSYRLKAIVPENHELAALTAVPLKELARYPLVLREPQSELRRNVEGHFTAVGVKPENLNVVMELNTPEAIRVAVAAGMGISVLSEVALQEAKSVHVLDITDPVIYTDLYVVYSIATARTVAGQAMIEFLGQASVRKHLDALQLGLTWDKVKSGGAGT